MSCRGRWTIRLVLFAVLVCHRSYAIAAEARTVAQAPLSLQPPMEPPQPSPGLSLRDVSPKVPTWRWAVPGTALAVGVAGLVWGVSTFAGSETACDRGGAPSCGSVLNRANLGVERIAAGAVISFAATVDLVRLWSETRVGTSVSVGPKGVAVGGRF